MNKSQLRVLSFKEMKDGWDHPSDPAPSHEVIDKVIEVLGKITVELPCTFPSFQGGVRFEWDTPGGAIEVDFFNDKLVYLTAINMEVDDELEAHLDNPKLHTIIDEFYAEHTK